MASTTFTVTGMTCDHCVRAVTQGVTAVAGVTSVDVDLESGLVTVGSDGDLDRSTLVTAIDEAGYQVAP